jgi:hypothetical protein
VVVEVAREVEAPEVVHLVEVLVLEVPEVPEVLEVLEVPEVPEVLEVLEVLQALGGVEAPVRRTYFHLWRGVDVAKRRVRVRVSWRQELEVVLLVGVILGDGLVQCYPGLGRHLLVQVVVMVVQRRWKTC